MFFYIYHVKRITINEIISRIKFKYGNKYDYSKVEYINMKTKINLICENNHSFYISPDNLLRGRGCSYCIGRNDLVNDLEKFVKKSNLIHNQKYDYSKFKWINSKTIGIIICKEHGEFNQTPNLHLSSGCKKCYHSSLKSNLNKFIKSTKNIHGDFYDYSKVDYINSKTKIIISCPTHGEFKQTPSAHLSGSGCKGCMVDRFRNTFESFLEKANNIHNNLYTYHKETYVDSRTKIKVTCSSHGDFYVSPDNHISHKQGCVSCSNNISKSETDWLDRLSINDNRQFNIKINGRLFKFDAYDPSTKTIYEFYGDFWHGNPEVYKQEDINCVNGIRHGELFRKTIERENYLKSLGYEIISIWESEYKKI